MGKHRKPSQDAAIVDFIKKHPAIARNLTKGDRATVKAAWEDLTLQLNSLGPPIKTAEEWRYVWKDWKQAVKKKIANIRREASATSGAPLNQVALTFNEEVIANVCHLFVAIDGVDGDETFGILQPTAEMESVDFQDDEPSPKRPRMEVAGCSRVKQPTENADRLAAMVAEESMVLREIKDELVELKNNAKEMLEERKKTNLILEKLILTIETSFN